MADAGAQMYWFNKTTGEVEFGYQSNALDRIGPFRTEAEAKNALEIVRERAAQWAAEDAERDA